eukprot:3419902-Rhodomonas_salina.1
MRRPSTDPAVPTRARIWYEKAAQDPLLLRPRAPTPPAHPPVSPAITLRACYACPALSSGTHYACLWY